MTAIMTKKRQKQIESGYKHLNALVKAFGGGEDGGMAKAALWVMHEYMQAVGAKKGEIEIDGSYVYFASDKGTVTLGKRNNDANKEE